jgi:hypothetical protein
LANRVNSAARSRARAAFKNLVAGNAGARLPVRRTRVTVRGVLFALAGFLGGLGALALVAFGLLTFRLAQGPIDLASLGPRIASSLEQRFQNRLTFSLGPTFLERTENGVSLGFEGVSIKDRAGRTLVNAPSGSVSLDLLSLAAFDVRPRRLDLNGLDLRLAVQADGSISVSDVKADAPALTLHAPPPRADGAQFGAPEIAALASDFIDAVTGQEQTVDRLGVSNGKLRVEDAATHKVSTFDNLNFSFDKSDGVAALNVSARGPDGPWSIVADAQGQGARGLQVEAHDISLDDMLLLMGRRERPFDLGMPISTKFDVHLAPDKTLAAMNGRVSLGAGYFKLDDPDHVPFLVDEATADWRWDPIAERVQVRDVQIFTGETHLLFEGEILSPSPSQRDWTLELHSNDTVLAAAREGEGPLRLDRIALKARYQPQARRFIVDDLSIAGPDAAGSLKMESVATDDGPTMKMDLSLARGSLTTLVRLWPSFISTDVHNWCEQNIRSGELESGVLSVDWDAAAYRANREKKAVPPDSVHGEFSASDVSVDLLPGLPPLTGVDGSLVMTGHTATIIAKHGSIEAAPDSRIAASEISFVVPSTTPAPINPAVATVRLQGGVDALANILSRDALKPFVPLPIDATTTKGQFDGRLTLDMKLGKTAGAEDQVVRADASLTNVTIDKFLGKERFEQGSLNVSFDRGALKISGDGKLFGASATVDAAKSPGDEGTAKLSFTVDDAARAKRGFASAAITGPMAVKLKAPLSQKSADVEVDLAKVDIENVIPGFSKAAGKSGKATFSLRTDADGAAIDNLTIEAGAATMKGSAQLSVDGALISAKLNSLRLSSGDDLKADVTMLGPVMKVQVRGTAFDARPILKSLATGGAPAGGRDVDLDLKVATVTGANKQSLSQLDFSVSHRDGQIQQASLNARLGGGALLAQAAANGDVRVRTADAGGLLSFLDLYTHMEGGALDLVLNTADGREQGDAVVRSFVLRNEPAMKQLVAAGQVQGPDASGASVKPVDADVVPFQRLIAHFSIAHGRVDVDNAVIHDQQMGLTTGGFIDFTRDNMDLSGTFIPAYQLNNLVSRIPVFGAILGGGAHEGLFGVNYRITGPASRPILNVSPLSALAPGFLRKIFGAIDGTAQPGEAAPARQQSAAPSR